MAVELERTVVLHKPLDEIVEYLADFAHAREWDYGTVSCTRIGEGPVEVGARWRNVSEFRGRQTELEYTLTRREPDHLTFVGRNKTVTSTDDLRFRAEPDGTRLTYHVRFAFSGLAALAAPLVRGSLAKLADDTMAQLEEVVNG